MAPIYARPAANTSCTSATGGCRFFLTRGSCGAINPGFNQGGKCLYSEDQYLIAVYLTLKAGAIGGVTLWPRGQFSLCLFLLQRCSWSLWAPFLLTVLQHIWVLFLFLWLGPILRQALSDCGTLGCHPGGSSAFLLR